MQYQNILTFWFEETSAEQHFTKDEKFDALIRRRFLETYWSVVRGECADWRESPEGRLAEIVVLDQFSRNMFRDDPQAFMYDPLALALAQEAVRTGDDKKLPEEKRRFLYMPFMHSESKKVHEVALELFETLDNKEALKYELKHKEIIDRFGRYPHRNKILERDSTDEERAFLKENPGF